MRPLSRDWLATRNLKATVHHHRLSTFPSDVVLRHESDLSPVRVVLDECSFVCTLLSTSAIDSTLIVGF